MSAAGQTPNAATLTEIAAAIGVTKQAIATRSKREEWAFDTTPHPGNHRKFYALDRLPEEVRAAVELHRAAAFLDTLEPGIGAWIDQRRLALSAEQRADGAVLGKLLCARALEAMADAPAAFSALALTAALADRYAVPAIAIDRWTQEAQGWLSRAAAEVPAAPIITLDAGEERRFAVAFWRSQIIAPILQHDKRSRDRVAAQKRLAGTKHLHPDGQMKKITAATLYNWCDLYENHGGIEALKPKLREDKGEARVSVSRNFDKLCPLDADAKAKLHEAMTLYIRSGWASGVAGWRDLRIMAERQCRELAVAAGWNPPKGVELVGRGFVEQGRAAGIVHLKLNDAKAYFDDYLPRVRRTAAYLRPMELVVGDVHPLDIAIDMPDGRRVYPRLISWHDLATNRIHVTVIYLQKREGVRREHIALSFTAMVEAWGLPERLYLDNGSEYSWDAMLKSFVDLAKLTGRVRAEYLSIAQDREMVAEAREQAVLTDTAIHRARPYNAPAKPIEGLFSVLEGTVFRMVPGWVGGDRMRKKTQNVGQEPAAYPGGESELFRAVDTALAYYHRKPQPGGWLDGKSPIEAYARHIAEGWQRIECQPQTLLLSFAETYAPTANRGTVTVNRITYYADAILPFTGQKLPTKVARHDPRFAFVFDPKTSKLIAAAKPEQAYDFRDPKGAEEQGRRAKWLSRYVAEVGESCARLDLVAEMEKVAVAGPEMPVAPVGATVEVGAEAEAMRKALDEHRERQAKELAAPHGRKPKKAGSLWSGLVEEDPLIKGLTWLPEEAQDEEGK